MNLLDCKYSKYDLFAINEYYKDRNIYKTICKNINGIWFEDNKFPLIYNPKQIVSTNSYILFYRRNFD